MKQLGYLKTVFLLSLICSLGIFLSGCEEATQENAKEKSLACRPYQTDAKVFFLKDQEMQVLEMKQELGLDGHFKVQLQKPDHLKNYEVTYKPDQIEQHHEALQKIMVSKLGKVKNQLLFTTFIMNYLEGEQLPPQKEKLQQNDYQVFEATIPGNYKYMKKEKLWVSEKELIPYQLEIYDEMNEPTIRILFSNFSYQ